jgi:hypothetical protein
MENGETKKKKKSRIYLFCLKRKSNQHWGCWIQIHSCLWFPGPSLSVS